MLEPSDHAKKLKGKRVQVYEDEAGKVEIRSGAVRYIREEQRKREEQLLARGRLTKRDKRLLAERRA